MIPALLILALTVAVALFVAACATDSLPNDSDVDPAPLPPALPAADLLVGTDASPVGRARVPDPGQTIDPPTSRPYVGRHEYAGEPLYRNAFAAQVGIDALTDAGGPTSYAPGCYRCAMGDPCSGIHETAAEHFGFAAVMNAARPGRSSDR